MSYQEIENKKILKRWWITRDFFLNVFLIIIGMAARHIISFYGPNGHV